MLVRATGVSTPIASSPLLQSGADATSRTASVAADAVSLAIHDVQFNTSHRTKADIVAKWLQYPPMLPKRNRLNPQDAFERLPVVTAPFDAGQLKAAYIMDGLNATNFVRYLAGLPDDIVPDWSLAPQQQAAALVNVVNGVLTHKPAHPQNMEQSLFDLGYRGSSSSNLSPGCLPFYYCVMNYMADSDPYNIDRVGHRRWILHPWMKETMFGFAFNESHKGSTMYVLDQDRPQTNVRYDYVAWPAAGYFPKEFFAPYQAWSVSLNSKKFENRSIAEIRVTLTRARDGKTWTLGYNDRTREYGGRYFNVETSNYGEPFCIIFRPDQIVDIQDGDTYRVVIDGLFDTSGRKAGVTYETTFFSMMPDVTASQLAALHNEDPEIRRKAVDLLGHLDSEHELTIPALLSVLLDREPSVRLAAKQALDEIVSSASWGTDSVAISVQFVKALHDKNTAVRAMAANALGQLGRAVVDNQAQVVAALVDALQDSEQEVRRAAARALGYIGFSARAAVPALVQMLLSDEHEINEESIMALDQISTALIFTVEPETRAAAVPLLRKALQSDNNQVRRAAAEMLGYIGTEAQAFIGDDSKTAISRFDSPVQANADPIPAEAQMVQDNPILLQPDIAPVSVAGATLISVYPLSDWLGAGVTYDPLGGTVSISNGVHEIVMMINSRSARIDGAATELAVAPLEFHGVVLVPLRSVAEAFGAYVHWNAVNQEVRLNMPGKCARIKVPPTPFAMWQELATVAGW